MNTKRLWIATVLGLVLGFVEWLLARGAGAVEIPWTGMVTIILSRGVLGFAIGISTWRLRWWSHGLALGLIFSLPQAFGALWVGFDWVGGLVAVLVLGLVIGLLIELVTSVVFKASGPTAFVGV
jgi:hypothetical protein